MNRLIFLLFILAGSASGQIAAQSMELGVAGGISLYSGDLAPKEFGLYFEEMHPSFGVFGRYNVGRAFSVRLGVHYAKISGSDENRTSDFERMLNFRTNILELALTGELNLLRLGNPEGLQVVPYLFGGAGFIHFNPETLFDGNYIELQPLGTEGQGLPGYDEPYSLNQVCFPIGGGIKFVVNETWTLGFEFGGRKLLTDYLDDVSDTRVNYLDILEGNGSLAATLSNPLIKDPETQNLEYQRGGQYSDWYYIGSATLSFHFGGGGKNSMGRRGRELGCPKF
jgi:hypothetical protein